ncbi:GntR family transcriptional regulator [Lactonifactor longoviformis]|uniref:Transcriptional regulator, GntR family n=2 Tax=Lactonifactor TaxID=420345 RepID=A0A1M4SWW2_9CLOT|nr:GntR family transcriptional regulator [Lactonifactor longoviformis]POP33638.1 GntR family transcriptional regulator [Lactonifactor longoviformis]SHE36670.1 transcriptional regulator, GntR family [Lactonifactor longoviformis DSM 17459]
MDERAEKMLHENPFLNNMELAYKLIFEDIILGKFQNGERMQQERLSLMYGMSRTPVREALMKLETEGYIKKDDRVGYKVSNVDIIDYIDFWEFRKNLESHIAYLAATNISIQQLMKLSRNLEKTKKMGNSGNSLEVFRCDEEFHKLVVESSGNKYFIDVYNLYEAKIRYYRYLFQQKVNASMIYDAHSKIYKALESRSEDAAKRAMYQHMNAFMRHLRDKLR